MGASSSVLLNLLADLAERESNSNSTGSSTRSLASQQARTALIATLSGALAGAFGADVGTAVGAAIIETENNSERAPDGRIILGDPVGPGRKDYLARNLQILKDLKREDPKGYAIVISQFSGTTAQKELRAAESLAIGDANKNAVGGEAAVNARLNAGETAVTINADAVALISLRKQDPVLANKLAGQSPAVRELVYSEIRNSDGDNPIGFIAGTIIGSVISREKSIDLYLALKSDEAGEFKGPIDSFIAARKSDVAQIAADIRSNSEAEASRLQRLGKTDEANNALVSGYGRAAALEAASNAVLDIAKLPGDYAANPSGTSARIARGLAGTVDAILRDETSVLQYAQQANQALNDPDPRKRGALYGTVAATAAITAAGGATAIIRRGAFRADAPSVDPVNPRPGSANSPNTDAEAGGGSLLPQFVGPTGRAISPADANRGFGSPPFDPSRPIFDFETNGTTTFQRVYTNGVTSPNGGFLLNADDIKGLTPQQIQDRFDLPNLPTHVVDVTPRAGTIIRTGTVNAGNFGGAGGGRQFLLRTPISPRAFVNPRPLPKGS